MEKKQNPKVLSKNLSIDTGVFYTLENWMEERADLLFKIICFLTILFSILMFNLRISEGGDDSTYIFAGYNYAKNFTGYYFTFNAPLYPMFISPFIKLFGINLYVLKIVSLLFNFFHVYFLFKALKGRVPYLVTLPIVIFAAINSHLLYFASQTYNEAMFLCFQSMFFYFFVELNDSLDSLEAPSIKTTWKKWLLVGIMAFLISLTKNLGIMIVPVMVLFFAFRKEWMRLFYAVGAFLVIKIPFELLKMLIWGSKGQFSAQGNILMQKDPYDATKGMEDFSGFIDRFFDNMDLYLSKRFFQIVGFMSEDSPNVSRGLAVLLILLLVVGLIVVIRKKNKILLLTSIYLMVFIGTSFVVLQSRWDQIRIILIFVPMMLALFFYGLYNLVQKFSVMRSVYLVVASLIVISSFISTVKKTNENIPSLVKNMKGDKYYGYTTDWINYLAMSEWCSKNLPDSAYVAARKAPMSFIYGNGKEFYPVYRVYTTDPDSLLAKFKKDKVTHMMLASLRMNPKKPDGNVINALHRMLQPIQEKYPEKVKLIQTIGAMEQTDLYEIKQ